MAALPAFDVADLAFFEESPDGMAGVELMSAFVESLVVVYVELPPRAEVVFFNVSLEYESKLVVETEYRLAA